MVAVVTVEAEEGFMAAAAVVVVI
ncbi:MAG: hypothetical protein RLZZ186_1735, partial [Cyanobacteriota bacterium]